MPVSKRFYEHLPRPHTVGLADEEGEAYYVGAEQALRALIGILSDPQPHDHDHLDRHYAGWLERFLDTATGGIQ